MFITFITTLKVLIRKIDVLFWAVAFPLVLITLFYAMFSSLDETFRLDPLPVVIVKDANYASAEPFAQMIDSLSSEDAEESPLFDPTYVANESAALNALETGVYKGYIILDRDGIPQYFMDPRRADSLSDPSQTIILNVLDSYLQNRQLITSLIEENPQLLADPAFLQSLLDSESESFTTHISLTANPPSDSVRYFYAVLAFSTIMMSTFGLAAIDMVLGNTSPLGARRSIGGQSKTRMLIPTLAAAWVLSFACVLVGFLYLRFVFGIGFGGKELAVVLTLALSTLAATFLGAFLGSLPLPSGAKSGFVALISCVLSLFAGLYGPFSQDIGDMVARELPLLSAANPVRQVADAFFSLYFYDGFAEMASHLLALLVLCVAFFVLAVLMLRRQRYASL